MAGILLAGENVTAEQRAAHARSVAAENKAAALERLAEIKARVGDSKLAVAERIDGKVLNDQVVPAGGYYSRKLDAGDCLRIETPGGGGYGTSG